MNGLLGILLIGINGYVLMRDKDNGIMMFAILSLIAPVFYFFSIAVQYNWLFFPILCIWSLNKGLFDLRQVNSITFLLLMSVIVDICATFFSFATGFSRTVSIMPFLGTLKYILIFDVLRRPVVIRERFGDILRIVLLVNTIVIIIEFALIQIFPAVSVFSVMARLFSTEGNGGSIRGMVSYLNEGGGVPRLSGTFPSSGIISIISTTGIGYFLAEYRAEGKSKSIISILMCLFCGMASSSKRFYLGGVLIVILCYLYGVIWNKEIRKRRKKFNPYFLIGIVVVVMAIIIIFNIVSDKLIGVDYYLSFLTQGRFLESFSTRFGENGIVNSMKPLIHQKWLIGVGEVDVEGVVFTDSSFYITLARQGVVGLSEYISVFILLFINIYRERSLYKALILSVLVFEFVIGDFLFTSLGILMLCFVAANPTFEREEKIKCIQKNPV